MNKISKKIVALATMAAFVLTLVPAAAFAGTADYQASKYMTSESNVEVAVGDEVETVFRILDASEVPANDASQVVVWAEDAVGNITSAATFTNAETSTDVTAEQASNNKNIWWVKTSGATTVKDGAKLVVKFSRSGNYTLHAGICAGAVSNDPADPLKGIQEFGGDVQGHNTVKVNPAAPADVDKTVLNQVNNSENGDVANNQTVELNPVLANNTDTDKFTLQAFDKEGKAIVGKEFKVTTNSANLTVTGDTVTDDFGKIELSYQAAVAGKYTIVVKADKYTANFIVDIPKDEATPDKITVVKDGGVAELSSNPNLAQAVQLDIVDKNGNSIAKTNANLTKKEPIWTTNKDDGITADGQNVVNYVEIVSQPEKAKLTDKDVYVKYDDTEGVYTLEIANAPTLKAGEYTVRLALLSGNATDVTFELADAGEAVSIEIDGDDTVKAGKPYTATAYYVDANGIKTQIKDNTNLSVGYSGVIDGALDSTFDAEKYQIGFTAMEGKDYYGTKVTLYVVDTARGIEAHKDVTVVDPTLTDDVTFEFDKTSGPISQDNTVKLTIKDEDGNVVKGITGQPLKAYVDSQSVEDANVSVDVTDVKMDNGKATFTVYSDKETTADIRLVTVVDGKYYAGTLTYAFGEQDVPVDTSVVMTIGSNDFIVNNEVVTVEDAAPYVAKDRTFVPFRALGEAIGADVVWDNDARTVTYTLGKTEVVMTIGETTYTVNGEEKTMDVAPEITGERTYVPVRFVGEALGFKVTALSAADGTTASVVFQK